MLASSPSGGIIAYVCGAPRRRLSPACCPRRRRQGAAALGSARARCAWCPAAAAARHPWAQMACLGAPGPPQRPHRARAAAAGDGGDGPRWVTRPRPTRRGHRLAPERLVVAQSLHGALARHVPSAREGGGRTCRSGPARRRAQGPRLELPTFGRRTRARVHAQSASSRAPILRTGHSFPPRPSSARPAASFPGGHAPRPGLFIIICFAGCPTPPNRLRPRRLPTRRPRRPRRPWTASSSARASALKSGTCGPTRWTPSSPSCASS